MGELITTEYTDWGAGVVTSMAPDALPPNAYLRGKNVEFVHVGGGRALVASRRGCAPVGGQLLSGSPIIGQHEFVRISSTTGFERHHLVVSDSGYISDVDSSGTPTTFTNGGSPHFTASTTQAYLPDFCDAQNNCYITNGREQWRFNGDTVTAWGMAAPSTAPTLADGGSAGNHNGTYEARVTFYNFSTDAESSAGPTSSTVTLVNRTMAWTNIPTYTGTTDPNETVGRRLWLRNTSTQSYFYLAATLGDNTTTSWTTSVSDTALTEIGPDTDENDPPPSDIRYTVWHRGRLFAASRSTLYYSKVGLPEAFDPDAYELVNPDDGQQITGLASIFDVVVVFKQRAVYALVGDDPETWAIRSIDATKGCVAHRSIVKADGKLFFWGERGAAVWPGGDEIEWIGLPFIAPTVSGANLNMDDDAQAKICGASDLANQRILWAVPTLGQAQNDLILPFNWRVARWESDGWDPMNISSMGEVTDTTGERKVMVGTYYGRLFRWGELDTDGVPEDSTLYCAFAAGPTFNSITMPNTSFASAGAGLVGCKLSIVSPSGNVHRVTVTTNTSLNITFTPSITDEIGTYECYVGGPVVDFWTGWLDQDRPFVEKRYRFVSVQLEPVNSLTDLRSDLYINYNMASSARSALVDVTVDDGVWDSGLWDQMVWDHIPMETLRWRVGRTSQALSVRLRHYMGNQRFTIAKIGVAAEVLSEALR